MKTAEQEAKFRKHKATTDRITKTLKNCTFTPRDSPTRTFDQFFTDQRNHFNKSQNHLLHAIQEAHKEECQITKPNYGRSKERVHHDDIVKDRGLRYRSLVKGVSMVSKKLSVSKYIKEHKNVLLSLHLNPEQEQRISFFTMQQIMSRMGLVNISNERLLVKIFNELKPDESNTISSLELMEFIAEILNVPLKNSSLNSARLHKDYHQLYLMRKNYKGYRGNYELPNNTVRRTRNGVWSSSSLSQTKLNCINKKNTLPYTDKGACDSLIGASKDNVGNKSLNRLKNAKLINKKTAHTSISEQNTIQHFKDQSIIKVVTKKAILIVEVELRGQTHPLNIYKGDNITTAINNFAITHSNFCH